MYSKLRERMTERFPDSFGPVQFVSHKLMILMIAWFVPPFSSLTSSYQPFQPSEKGTDRDQPTMNQPHPARARVNVKCDAELTRVGVQPGLV